MRAPGRLLKVDSPRKKKKKNAEVVDGLIGGCCGWWCEKVKKAMARLKTVLGERRREALYAAVRMHNYNNYLKRRETAEAIKARKLAEAAKPNTSG